MKMNQAGQSMPAYYAGKLKLSEHEFEEIQAFLESVHHTLHIPLVLQESNPEYPIGLAENHYGISTEEHENLVQFIKDKYHLGHKKVKLKVLISGSQNRVHVGLSQDLIKEFIKDSN